MEVDWFLLILLLLAGALGGFISGLLGVGGGLIFIPVLDILLSSLVSNSSDLVKYLLANSLLILFFTGALNSLRQIRIGNYYPKSVLITSAAGIITVSVSTWLINRGSWYSRPLFSMIFLLLLIPLTLNMFRPLKQLAENANVKPMNLIPIGIGGGLVSAFAGLGGGVLMIPALTGWLKLPMKFASSISAGVIPFMALPVITQYALAKPTQALEGGFGYLLPVQALPMIIGTLSTVSFGIKMGHRWPDKVVRLIFAVFIALVMLRTAFNIFFSH